MTQSSRQRYRVTIAQHQIPPRWEIAEQHVIVHTNGGERIARINAIRTAHIKTGVPPLRSMLAQSWRHTKAIHEPDTPFD